MARNDSLRCLQDAPRMLTADDARSASDAADGEDVSEDESTGGLVVVETASGPRVVSCWFGCGQLGILALLCAL